MTGTPSPGTPALVAAGAVLALPAATSWLQVASFALILLVALAALHFWRRRDAPADDRLDTQPLLPGEARWLVGRNGTVLDSCTHESEHGIATGWAVGHNIAEWAPPGSPQAEHYRAALEDRSPACHESTYTGADGAERVGVIHLQPRSDGTVYCESWDVTEYVRRARVAEADARLYKGQRDRLMAHATADAVALATAD